MSVQSVSPVREFLFHPLSEKHSTPKYKMTDNLRKIMELDSEPVDKRGYLIHRGEDEGNFSEQIEYINYRTFFDRFNEN